MAICERPLIFNHCSDILSLLSPSLLLSLLSSLPPSFHPSLPPFLPTSILLSLSLPFSQTGFKVVQTNQKWFSASLHKCWDYK